MGPRRSLSPGRASGEPGGGDDKRAPRHGTLLRSFTGCGYGAQEFISAAYESLKIWLAALRIAMTVPVKKADTIRVRLFSLLARMHRAIRQCFSRAMLHFDMQLGRQTFLP
jgi:hypothetical protein